MVCKRCGTAFTSEYCPNCGKKGEEWTTYPEPAATWTPNIVSKYIEVDEAHQLWRVKDPRKTDPETWRALLALCTLCVSLIIEQIVKLIMRAVKGDAYDNAPKIPKDVYRYEQFISYDLVENDISVQSGGAFDAMVGASIGRRMGGKKVSRWAKKGGIRHITAGLGAIAAAQTATRTTEQKITRMVLVIKVHDIQRPTVIVSMITSPARPTSRRYRKAYENAQQVMATLDIIARQVEQMQIKAQQGQAHTGYVQQQAYMQQPAPAYSAPYSAPQAQPAYAQPNYTQPQQAPYTAPAQAVPPTFAEQQQAEENGQTASAGSGLGSGIYF